VLKIPTLLPFCQLYEDTMEAHYKLENLIELLYSCEWISQFIHTSKVWFGWFSTCCWIIYHEDLLRLETQIFIDFQANGWEHMKNVLIDMVEIITSVLLCWNYENNKQWNHIACPKTWLNCSIHVNEFLNVFTHRKCDLAKHMLNRIPSACIEIGDS
jgi:hypothetical protein